MSDYRLFQGGPRMQWRRHARLAGLARHPAPQARPELAPQSRPRRALRQLQRATPAMQAARGKHGRWRGGAAFRGSGGGRRRGQSQERVQREQRQEGAGLPRTDLLQALLGHQTLPNLRAERHDGAVPFHRQAIRQCDHPGAYLGGQAAEVPEQKSEAIRPGLQRQEPRPRPAQRHLHRPRAPAGASVQDELLAERRRTGEAAAGARRGAAVACRLLLLCLRTFPGQPRLRALEASELEHRGAAAPGHGARVRDGGRLDQPLPSPLRLVAPRAIEPMPCVRELRWRPPQTLCIGQGHGQHERLRRIALRALDPGPGSSASAGASAGAHAALPPRAQCVETAIGRRALRRLRAFRAAATLHGAPPCTAASVARLLPTRDGGRRPLSHHHTTTGEASAQEGHEQQIP
mmetsp:Transcript_56250/g.182592  ORF Transcript_56250/g.182592 Transcript_56250/m.182592 type:complete len:405 (+) Transcript_56250:1694-2908(+)